MSYLNQPKPAWTFGVIAFGVSVFIVGPVGAALLGGSAWAGAKLLRAPQQERDEA